jgi:hypothetical protein
LAVAQPAGAQVARPRPGQFEVHGLDFRPNGAWRQRTNGIRAQRQAMLASGQFARMNVSGPSSSAAVVTGHFEVPVVPIYFKDSVPALFPVADYQELFFSPARLVPYASRPTTSSSRTTTSRWTARSSPG